MLHSQILRETAAELGVEFLSIAPTASDAEGFLLEPYWNPDPTHANAHYGGCVLDALISSIREVA